jgi:flagellar basal-body rod protein FlgB
MTNSIFGISEQALQLCEDRGVMLSGNVVNSATPNYKARDINFHQLLKDQDNFSTSLAVNEVGHMKPSNLSNGESVMYRVPMQTSMDGNTVDEEIERKNFLQNALNYQVNLTFVKSQSDQLMKAIKGE